MEIASVAQRGDRITYFLIPVAQNVNIMLMFSNCIRNINNCFKAEIE